MGTSCGFVLGLELQQWSTSKPKLSRKNLVIMISGPVKVYLIIRLFY
ncbi:18729_t:CDS:2 [Gigaspora margarita]|uniref:18729_t:CDS:1 n=1 Tax=Gigaspora margarita TaxID=4874 RepID=A0ABN7UXD1_GIGMA|nr:18729_t:CDS:2 [Gigaspora margarita]